MNILLIEDDDVTIFINTRVIKTTSPDAQILLAKNGREAIALLKNETALDLIIVDGSMPDIDGWEFIQIIQGVEFSLYQNTPIVLLTSSILDEDFIKTNKLGRVKHIFNKPLDQCKFNTMLNMITDLNS